MALRKTQKLMLLFVSKDNPLWQSILGHPPTQVEIKQITGADAGKISKWRSGDTISEVVAGRTFEAAIRYLESSPHPGANAAKRKVEKFQKAFSAPESMIETAAILGLNVEKAQRALDHIIYEEMPLFPKMYEGTGDEGLARANEVMRQYGGIYHCYLERGQETLICALRVRYALKIGSGWAIRCKLNVPKTAHWRSGDDPEIWEYDGFLSRRERNLFWTFEKRSENRSDYLYFITSTEHTEGKCLKVSGTYLTTNQSPEPTITTGQAFLERAHEYGVKAITNFMRTTPDITSGRP